MMDWQHQRAGRRFTRLRTATVTRLQRVNEALSRWDEYEVASLMPADIRPDVEAPAVSRTALKDLQRMLSGFLIELEAAWELRN